MHRKNQNDWKTLSAVPAVISWCEKPTDAWRLKPAFAKEYHEGRAEKESKTAEANNAPAYAKDLR